MRTYLVNHPGNTHFKYLGKRALPDGFQQLKIVYSHLWILFQRLRS